MEPEPKYTKAGAKLKRKQIVQQIQEAIDKKDKQHKPHYFYLRDPETNTPIVTVCEIYYNNNLYRGIAICSYKDNPNKKKGRHIAFNRAVTAILTNQNMFPIHRWEAFEGLETTKIFQTITSIPNIVDKLFKAQVNKNCTFQDCKLITDNLTRTFNYVTI